MGIEIRHLKLVDAIAQDGNLTRAATRLHVTQAALSQQLRHVEITMKTTFFERQGRKMILTFSGERLLRAAHIILGELDRAEKEIEHGRSLTQGHLRIATQCYTVYHWLPSRVRLFHQKFPHVQVQVVTEATPNPFQALFEDSINLAIVVKPIRNRKIEYTPLFQDEMVVVVSPAHRLSKKAFLMPEDFAGEHLIVYPPRRESTALNEILEPAGVTPGSVLEVRLTEAVFEMVKEGMGIALMAKWAVAPQLTIGEVCALRVGRKGFFRQWSAARVRGQTAPAYFSEFVNILARHPISVPVQGKSRLPRTRHEHADSFKVGRSTR